MVTFKDSAVVDGNVGAGGVVVSGIRVMLDISLQSVPVNPSLQKHVTSVVHT